MRMVSKFTEWTGLVMGPRWKGKGAEVKALADPISGIVSQLQSSLISSHSRGLLSGTSVLLKADAEQTDLFNRACFGRPKVTSDKNEQWFQLCMEEAFYLQYSLKCIKVVDHNDTELNSNELWRHLTSRRENFPILFKAFSHLRTKNWVVRSGSQYGVDFVAYRHHPALVHSEYAVLALSSQNGSSNGRLRVWSDFHCTLRLCGSVAKTLLILDIEQQSCATSPSCLDNYVVQERTITRWSPEQGRETKGESRAFMNVYPLQQVGTMGKTACLKVQFKENPRIKSWREFMGKNRELIKELHSIFLGKKGYT